MIKLENVTKVYKTGVRAVNNMNVNIGPGEFVYVLDLLEQENLLLLSYYIEKKKQLLVKLLLLERMFLRLKIVRFLILEEISELSFKTLDFYQKRLFLKTLLLL